MGGNVEFHMALYCGLPSDVEAKLKRIDAAVAGLFLAEKDAGRPIWTTRAGASGVFIQLGKIGTAGIHFLIDLAESEVLGVSEGELVKLVESRLSHAQ